MCIDIIGFCSRDKKVFLLFIFFLSYYGRYINSHVSSIIYIHVTIVVDTYIIYVVYTQYLEYYSIIPNTYIYALETYTASQSIFRKENLL